MTEVVSKLRPLLEGEKEPKGDSGERSSERKRRAKKEGGKLTTADRRGKRGQTADTGGPILKCLEGEVC